MTGMFLVLLCSAAYSQTESAPNPADIIRRSVERDRRIHDARAAGLTRHQIADDERIFGRIARRNLKKQRARRKLVYRVLSKPRP